MHGHTAAARAAGDGTQPGVSEGSSVKARLLPSGLIAGSSPLATEVALPPSERAAAGIGRTVMLAPADHAATLGLVS